MICHFGKEKNRKDAEEKRDADKAIAEKKISELKFPPIIDNDFESNETTCISNFIDRTCSDSMQTFECGVCGEAVMKRDGILNHKYTIDTIPNRELLSKDNQNDLRFLPAYDFHDLLLSPGGVIDGEVQICKISEDRQEYVI